jgi:putative oxygen-independent coproporphyrinogen III oxidase
MTLGIYIQVPFCQTKCTYCNFHTGVVSRDRYQPYAEAVCREIAGTASATPESVDTVYIGGGTPSLLDPGALAKMLDTLRGSYRMESQPEPLEVTLEADPETITAEKARAWIAAGFNRISLGSQSFDDRELQAAGRMHRRADIFSAVEFLRTAGLGNISMDLIAGLPHQTRESWEESVSQLLQIGPEHASVYMLEIDKDSRLGRESLAGGSRYGAAAIPDDDTIADFYESARQRLDEAGYTHYEISNWGLPGRESRHNLKYWRREPYYGFGAGAHSFDGMTRWANAHESSRYMACIEQGSSPREQFETLTPPQALDEELFLGLRMLGGIDFERIEREWAPELPKRMASLRENIDRLQSLGFLEVEGPRVRLVPDRLTVSNEVFMQLLG